MFLKQILFGIVFLGFNSLSFALDASSVAPQDLLQKAKSSGLVNDGPSVAAFTWYLDVKKPLKSARRQVEAVYRCREPAAAGVVYREARPT
jgi:hypothetical protein